jgi:hypothetical protein
MKDDSDEMWERSMRDIREEEAKYLRRVPLIPKVGDTVWRDIQMDAIGILQRHNYEEPLAPKPKEKIAVLLSLLLEAMVGRLQELGRTPSLGDSGPSWDTDRMRAGYAIHRKSDGGGDLCVNFRGVSKQGRGSREACGPGALRPGGSCPDDRVWSGIAALPNLCPTIMGLEMGLWTQRGRSSNPGHHPGGERVEGEDAGQSAQFCGGSLIKRSSKSDTCEAAGFTTNVCVAFLMASV